jgi:hypothetical protein
MCEKTVGKTSERQMFAKRLLRCSTASVCHRLCPRLVKAPGVALVYCVDPVAGKKVDLYNALADPEFACPDGRFSRQTLKGTTNEASPMG